MLKLTLQDLCFRGILKIEQRAIVIDSHHPQKRLRLFFSHGESFPGYKTNSEAQNFFLQLFTSGKEIRLVSIRWHVRKSADENSFDKLVYHDLKGKGLCWLWLFPTRKARRLKDTIKHQVQHLEENFDTLYTTDKEGFVKCVEQLGPHILLLHEDYLKKLEGKTEALRKIGFLNQAGQFFNSEVFNSMGAFSAVGVGGVSMSFGGGGGFGGFGGGSFGGGGASGSW